MITKSREELWAAIEATAGFPPAEREVIGVVARAMGVAALRKGQSPETFLPCLNPAFKCPTTTCFVSGRRSEVINFYNAVKPNLQNQTP